ncbi:RsmB/NOP family class I SAM-dependent RNA methyltransferase [Sphingomonas sp. LY160]|uniref:RsmB/NOP family class I SAM-dependent RNA methyltransferase n=1 Tax=Sphingomonas sp. LY160 TaxID=3095342 RepID=UPI002ADEF05C|nr:RsmB/NOP family class I SAM-dependent RNA methyltransferase [Sphingomonas sp. LY160]MEA1072443.1 RsmB/NOP family class I SAM-dependent RNA methyltransferase [Sphingomonas sp. LY160]
MPRPDQHDQQPDGLPARAAALRILEAVLRRGQTVDNAAQIAGRLPPADAALALAIVGETLRRLPDFDALIDSATRLNLADDAKARMVLRLALAQKIGLGTPDHAVVSTALPLVDGGPRRLVHGVLGTLLRRGLPPIVAPLLPQAVEERWREAWGDEMVDAARRSIAQRPPLDLSFATQEDADAFPDGVALAPRHRRVADAGSVQALSGYGEGRWWVQDLAASLPARLIPSDAMRVLDACAAPGGKTMQLAAAGHAVTALDRSESRLARLAENMERTGLAADRIVGDVFEWQPDAPYDAVLLDAPCSATGTFRRHPEVLYRARPSIIEETSALQARLLARAADWVRPGGSLVYAVCSLEPSEGEQRIDQLLVDRPDFRIEPAAEVVGGVKPHERGWLRILPGMIEDAGGLDGFFAAHLVRTG